MRDRARLNDQGRRMRERVDQTPTGLWEAVKAQYPEKIRAMVDAAMKDRGMVSLADLMSLELAEHARLTGLLEEALADHAKGGKVGHKTLAALASVQLQVRKNLRTLALEANGSIDPNKIPVNFDALPWPFDQTPEEMDAMMKEWEANPDEILST